MADEWDVLPRDHPEHPDPMFDYRCPNGHVFAAPPAPHGWAWSSLVCPSCGLTAVREFHTRPEWSGE